MGSPVLSTMCQAWITNAWRSPACKVAAIALLTMLGIVCGSSAAAILALKAKFGTAQGTSNAFEESLTNLRRFTGPVEPRPPEPPTEPPPRRLVETSSIHQPVSQAILVVGLFLFFSLSYGMLKIVRQAHAKKRPL